MDPEELKSAIALLRLQPGDILVLDPDMIGFDMIQELRLPLPFPVPVIFAPTAAVTQCSRKQLLEVLAKLPQEPADA